MNVLIIDDDELKLEQLIEFLSCEFKNFKLSTQKSYHSGLNTILKENENLGLILLDMSMPTFDITAYETGGRRRSFAGRDILDQMKWNEINIPVIIVTQFESFEEYGRTITLLQLSYELKKSFSDSFIGHVFFKSSQMNWKENLKKLINNNERVAIASARDFDN